MGTKGSEVRLEKPGKVKITARVAAMLNEKPNPDLRGRPYQQKPYWHIERARLGGTRKVPVEVIVNGEPVFRKEIVADGKLQDFSAEVELSKSSWVALRILPSCHTNPVFVIVGDKPIRASKKSAQWCLESVDQCWKQKKGRIRKSELAEAAKSSGFIGTEGEEAMLDNAREIYAAMAKRAQMTHAEVGRHLAPHNGATHKVAPHAKWRQRPHGPSGATAL